MTFWIVWNPRGNNPKYKHDSYDAAVKEANRLRRENPSSDFIVLKNVDEISDPVHAIINRSDAARFSFTLSDVICFLKGYRAGRLGEHNDPTDFITIGHLQELNAKIKDQLPTDDIPF